MRAGRLRQWVFFESPVESKDATGAPIVNAFASEFAVLAEVEPLRGAEFADGRAIRGEMDTRITVRWQPRMDVVTEKWRARMGSRLYDLKSVAQIRQGRRSVEIMAKSGLNQG